MVLEERDLILHKALAETSKKALAKLLVGLEKKCLGLLRKFEAIESEYSNSNNIGSISRLSKLYKEKENSMISTFALKNRVQILINRNEARIAYIDAKLKDAGIYNEKFDKKEFSEIQKTYFSEISEISVNINLNAKGSEVYKLVNGEIYLFREGRLSFEDEFNQAVLLSLDSSELAKIVQLFPYSVATIPVELLINTTLKQRLLKEIASYVIEESKTKTIGEINRELGSLLSFKQQYTENAVDYIAGVQNMFDVQVKQEIAERYPGKLSQIFSKLKCNDKSELIPDSKITGILANGLAGEVIKDENQESEELRIEKEKEDQNILEAMQLLSDLLAEQEETLDDELQAERREDEQKKNQEILNRKKEEEDEQKLKEDELEKLLSSSLTKHDDD